MVIFAAIAVALVKVAFFAGATQSVDPTLPTGAIVEPQSTVETGTITNDVTLKGAISADAAVPIKATLAGEVTKVLVTQGQTVDAKTAILTVRSETAAADGTPVVKTVTVLAGSTGTLSSFPVIVGQLVSVGDAVGQVAPPSFSVTGTLSPEQQYRLLNQPTEATVAITGGPAPFTCTGLTIRTAVAGAPADAAGDPAGASPPSGTTVRCAVPAGVKVFGGLAATLTISGGVADNVLVVPVTAVEGSAGTGIVYTPKADGSSEKHAVGLGLTDGSNVEITTGLKAGDKILQFVPGAVPAQDADGCVTTPDGGNICQGSSQ
jgi:multidrug efflux pump subunit AcrA (membrane-fusion protein)